MKKILIGLLLIAATFTTQAQEVGNVFYKTVDVSSAEILASFTTEKVLVEAPNSAYAIIPLAVTVEMKFGSAAYSDASGASFVTYSGSSTGLAFTTILASTSSQVQTIAGVPILARTAVKGKNLVYKHTTANPTTGNGTMRIWIAYRLVNLENGGY
jgi:hypothetical protein